MMCFLGGNGVGKVLSCQAEERGGQRVEGGGLRGKRNGSHTPQSEIVFGSTKHCCFSHFTAPMTS